MIVDVNSRTLVQKNKISKGCELSLVWCVVFQKAERENL